MGGYVDTDDVYLGSDINVFFTDDKLKIQPLCYDITTDSMIPRRYSLRKTLMKNLGFLFQ